MKFLMARDLRLKPKAVWELLRREKELVVTSNGSPVALMVPVDGNTLESELDLLNRVRALKALDAIQHESVNRGLDQLSMEEINAEIHAVRKKKSCRKLS